MEAHLYTHTHIFSYIHMDTCTDIYTHMYTIHTDIYSYIPTYTYRHMHAHIHTYTHNTYTYTYMHYIYIHTHTQSF